MKQNKKKKNVVIRAVLLLVLVAVIITGCIFSHFGGFGTGPCADTEEFVKYAGQIEDIKIPEGTRFVLVGNHQSKFDPILSWYILRKKDIAFISKPENFKQPIFGRIIRKCCFH